MNHRKVIRKKTVLQKLQVSNSTLHRRIREGTFPPPFHLGERLAVWWEDELDTVMRLYAMKVPCADLKKAVQRMISVRGTQNAESN